MNMQPESVDLDFYVLVEPRWSDWRVDEQKRPVLNGARLGKATMNRPTVGSLGGVIVKLKVRLDAASFLPLQPEVVVHVHPGMAETVEVEALDPAVES